MEHRYSFGAMPCLDYPGFTHHAPRTTHHAPRTTHHAPRTTHHLRQTSHLFGQVAGEVETDEATIFGPERGRVAQCLC